MESIQLFLPDTEATAACGRLLGELLRVCSAPRAVLLYGPMGSGKTTLTRSIVEALPGHEQAEINSPSFTLVNQYPTTPPVVHADLFRLLSDSQHSSLPDELEEALYPTSPGSILVLVEWAEHIKEKDRPAKRLDISLQPCQAARLLSATPHGEAANKVCARLFQAIPHAWKNSPCRSRQAGNFIVPQRLV